MDFLHIIGTIFDDSINHIVALAKQIYDENWTEGGKNGDNQQNINQYLLQQIRNFEDKNEHSKGIYSSLSNLQNAVPNPVVGDWGVISSNSKLIICRCNSNGVWTQTSEEFTLQVPLGEYIKSNQLKTINNQSLLIEGNNTNISISGGSGGLEYPIVNSSQDGIVSSNQYQEWTNIKNIILPKLREDIDDLYLLIESSPEQIQEIVSKYNQIKEFIENLNPNDDVLLDIIQRISDLEQAIEELRTNGVGSEDNIKHIILTQREYNSLSSYERDTLYIVIGNGSNTWGLGDELPIILASEGGNQNPVSEGWSFGSQFPIIFT